MSGAVRFVVAAAIVALFGGFLLSGVLTTQPSDEAVPAAVTASPLPTTTDDLLSGMVTEEVEPGVLRIVNDGYRDLWHRDKGFEYGRSDAVIVGATGAVWRITPDHRLFRLGEEAEWSYRPRRTGGGRASATPRRVPMAGSGPSRWEASACSMVGRGTTDGMCCDPWAVAVGGDGTVWALGDEGLMWTLPGGEGFATSDWADVYDGEALGLAVTDDGEAWLLGISHGG